MRARWWISGAASAAVVASTLAAAPRTGAAAATQRIAWHTVQMPGKSHLGEPSLTTSDDGVVYITAPGPSGSTKGAVTLYRSTDRGTTFQEVALTPTFPLSTDGGDTAVDVLSDGSVNVADLELRDSIVYHATDRFSDPSADRQTTAGGGTTQDRPWLGHLCDHTAYLVYHDVQAEEEWMATSHDGGVTWGAVPSLVSVNTGTPDTALLGQPPAQGSTPSQTDTLIDSGPGPVVVDQATGQIYAVYSSTNAAQGYSTPSTSSAQNTVIVATSTDGGATFTDRYAYAGPYGTTQAPSFPWLTIDTAGTVYVGWAGNSTSGGDLDAYYTFSRDHAVTWHAPVKLNNDETGTHVFTTLAAGDPGVLDVAWYSTPASTAVALSTPGPTTPEPDTNWYVDFAQVRDADTSNPRITHSRITDQPFHHGTICMVGALCVDQIGADRSLLDFFTLALDPWGNAIVVWPDNSQVGGGKLPTMNDNHLVFARQSSGPTAYAAPRQVCGHTVGGTAHAALAGGNETADTVPWMGARRRLVSF